MSFNYKWGLNVESFTLVQNVAPLALHMTSKRKHGVISIFFSTIAISQRRYLEFTAKLTG